MSLIQLVLLLLGGMCLTLLVAHIWVAIVDGFVGIIKKILHLDKKKKIHWNTLDKNEVIEPKELIKEESHIYEQHNKSM